MEDRAAKIISYLFHPIFMPFYGMLLLFNFQNIFSLLILFKAKLVILGFVFACTVILPLLIILMMKKQGFVKNLLMDERTERTLPYMVIALFYFITYHLFRQLELPFVYSLFLMGSAMLIALVTLINFRWKISIHMVGIGGITGMFIGLAINLSLNLIIMIGSLIFLSGIIGFARMQLNAHKASEIYAGFFAGVLVMAGLFLIF